MGKESSENKNENDGNVLRIGVKETFDNLVAAYGVEKAVARGLRASLSLPANGKISETEFVKALKKFTGRTPR